MNKILMKSFVKKIIRPFISIPQKISCPVTMIMIMEQTDWINKLYSSFLFWNKIIPGYQLQYYLYDLRVQIRRISINPLVFDSIKSKWLVFFKDKNTDEEIKFFLTKLLFLCGVFDDEICKEIIKFASETDREDYRYWIAQDVSFDAFTLQKGFYKEFYTQRRELLKKIAIEGGYIIPQRSEVVITEKPKICIIAYLLAPSLFNSMQRVATMFAQELQKHNYEIVVLTLDSFYVGGKDKKCLNTTKAGRNNLSLLHKREIDAIFGDNIRVEYVTYDNYKDRFQEALDKLYQINPNAIIDITDEFSPISYFYSKDFPTVYMPLRVGASSSFYTHLVGTEFLLKELDKKYHFLQNESIINWVFPEYVPPKTKPYTRSEKGLPDDAFIIVTVSKCSNCSKSFIDEMASLLLTSPDMIWVIVADKAPVYMHDRYPVLFSESKIIERGYETQLTSLFAICNVLLRTDTTGGSGATAMAAMSGLPIAMTDYICDPMRWLGKDFSTIDNYKDLMLYIQKLHDDSFFYKQEAERAHSKVLAAIDSDSIWNQFSDLLKTIIRR